MNSPEPVTSENHSGDHLTALRPEDVSLPWRADEALIAADIVAPIAVTDAAASEGEDAAEATRWTNTPTSRYTTG